MNTGLKSTNLSAYGGECRNQLGDYHGTRNVAIPEAIGPPPLRCEAPGAQDKVPDRPEEIQAVSECVCRL